MSGLLRAGLGHGLSARCDGFVGVGEPVDNRQAQIAALPSVAAERGSDLHGLGDA